ncbi:MAG: hypothetical protein KC503_33040 [Myxococcales bacterium]|nr:hypothetical protein [Myxococcales bacterium]
MHVNVLRALKMLLVGIGLTLLSVIVLALLIFFYPPAELLREAGLGIAQSALAHRNIHIGSMKLDLLRRVEIRDIWLGPPAGYRLPLLTVRRILLEYDISEAASGRIVVKRVLIDTPKATAEQRGGKLSWQAFVDAMPKGPKKPEPKKKDKPSEGPPAIDLSLASLEIKNIGAYAEGEGERALFDGLTIAAKGRYAKGDGSGEVKVTLAPAKKGWANVAVRTPAKDKHGAMDVAAALKVTLRTTLQSLLSQAAKLALDIELEPKRFEAAGMLGALKGKKLPMPPRFALALRARADMKARAAEVTSLRAWLGKHELLSLAAKARELAMGKPAPGAKPTRVQLSLRSLDVPIDMLAPYVTALQPDLSVGGRVRVKKLQVQTRLDKPAEVAEASGRIEIEKLRLAMAKRGVDVRGVEARFDLARRVKTQAEALSPRALAQRLVEAGDGSGEDKDKGKGKGRSNGRDGGGGLPGVSLRGRLDVGRAKAAGATVDKLALRLAVAAEQRGLEPSAAAARIGLRLGSASYRAPGLGMVRTGLGVDLVAHADVLSRAVELERLRVEAPGLVRVGLRARASLPKRTVSAKLDVDRVKLRSVIARLPPKLRRSLRALGLRGAFELGLQVDGRLPDTAKDSAFSRLLARGGGLGLGRAFVGGSRVVPLRARVTVKGRGISMAQRGGVRARGVSLDVKLDARPGRIGLGTRFRAREARGPSFSARRVDAPIDIKIDNKRLALRLTPSIGQASGGGARVAAVVLRSDIGMPVQPLFAARRTTWLPLTMKSAITVGRLREARAAVRGVTVKHELTTQVPLAAIVRRRAINVGKTKTTLSVGLGKLKAAMPGLRAGGAGVALKIDAGVDPSLSRPVSLKVDLAAARLSHEQLAARVDDIKLALATSAGGVPLRFPAPPIVPNNIETGPLSISLRVARVRQRGAPPPPPRGIALDAALHLGRGGMLNVDKVAFAVRSHKVHVSGRGRVKRIFYPYRNGEVPPLSIALKAGIDAPKTRQRSRAFAILPGLRLAGSAGLSLKLASKGRRLAVDGRISADNVHVWQSGGGSIPRPDGTRLESSTLLHVANLHLDIPIKQTIYFGRRAPRLLKPRVAVFERAGRGRLYPALRPYAARRESLALDQVLLREKLTAFDKNGKVINTRERKVGTGKIALDLELKDSTLLMHRMFIHVLGGDIAGSLRAQIRTPLDILAAVRAELTRVDPTRLVPGKLAPAPISALLDLRYRYGKRYLDGRINISKLSLTQLDALLLYLDPNEVDANVQRTRGIINAWYMRLAKPRIKLVAIWFKYGNLNIDIKVQARVLEDFINRKLHASRIRRVSIASFAASLFKPEPKKAPR